MALNVNNGLAINGDVTLTGGSISGANVVSAEQFKTTGVTISGGVVIGSDIQTTDLTATTINSVDANLTGDLTLSGGNIILNGQTITSENNVADYGTGVVLGDIATNVASGNFAIAEGSKSTALGANSHAEGYKTTATAPYSHAEGYYATATGNASHAEGSAVAYGVLSHAEGENTLAMGIGSHASGKNARAIHDNSFVWSEGTTFLSQGIGTFNVHTSAGGAFFSGGDVTIENTLNADTVYGQTVLGPTISGALLVSSNAVITTINATETFTSSLSASIGTIDDLLTGNITLTGGNISGAGIISTDLLYVNGSPFSSLANFGDETGGTGGLIGNILQNTASGEFSVAEGDRTTATGDQAHAEGAHTTALGFNSHAEGWYTTAEGWHSHTEGRLTTTFYAASHAEGRGTFAHGYYSHAEGYKTTAHGDVTHASGENAKAIHDNSFVWSDGTDFASKGIGTFNIHASGGVHVAGDILPTTGGVYSLGTSAQPFKDLYLTDSSLYLGSTVVTASGGQLYVDGINVGDGIDLSNSNSDIITTGIISGAVLYGDGSNLINVTNENEVDDTTIEYSISGGGLRVKDGGITATKITSESSTDGYVLTSDGLGNTNWEEASGGLNYSVVSVDTNAIDGKGYLVDVTGGVVTITLPASPLEGWSIGVVDFTGNSGTNSIFVERNGENIKGVAEDLEIDLPNSGFVLVYTNSSEGWVIASEIAGAGGVSLDVDNLTIENDISGSGLQVKDGGITGPKLASDINITTTGIISGTFYGDGSNLTGIEDIFITDVDGLSGGQIVGDLSATGIISGTFYGDGSNLTGIEDIFVTDVDGLSGGELIGELSVTGNISGSSFYGDGSNLTGIAITEVDGLSGGQIIGNLSTTGNISGTFYGDGSNLTGIAITEVDGLSGGQIIGDLSVTGNISGSVLYGDGSNLTGLVDLTNVTTDILPASGGAYDLGSLAKPFKDLYLTENSIFLGGTSISISGGELLVGGSGALENSSSDITTTGNISANSLYANIVSAPIISGGVLYGDGSNLTGIEDIFVTDVDGLSGGNIIGDVSVSGNISGSAFYGDGSNLSGINNILNVVDEISGSATGVRLGDTVQNRAYGNFAIAEGNSTTAYGTTSHAEGNYTTTIGYASHAEGTGTTAFGDYAHAEGVNTSAYGEATHAEGSFTTALGNYSHAEGAGTTAIGNFSHAGGSQAIAKHDHSFVWSDDVKFNSMGQGTFNIHASGGVHISGGGLFVNGQEIISGGEFNFDGNADFGGDLDVGGNINVVGNISGAVLYGDGANLLNVNNLFNVSDDGTGVRIGDTASNDASGTNSIASGKNASATDNNSFVWSDGTATTSQGDATFTVQASGGIYTYGNIVTEGDITTTGNISGSSFYGDGANLNNVPSTLTTVEGLSAGSLIGDLSTVGNISGSAFFGDGSNLSGMFVLQNVADDGTGVVLGDINNNVASGNFAVAEGRNTTAAGFFTHSEGWNTTALGDYSHVEGYRTTSILHYASHAEGYYTLAIGANTHTEGFFTVATASIAHAEGDSTLASGIASHAEGAFTTSLGRNSHAEGRYTHASGQSSHTEGYATVSKHISAGGVGAHAEGYALGSGRIIADGLGAHAEGYAGAGQMNIASGKGSHAEGINTTAVGYTSHASGENAKAKDDNSFVWSDGTEFFSQGTQTFNIHASGGTHISGGPLTLNGYQVAFVGYGTSSSNLFDEGSGVRIGDITNNVASGDYTLAQGKNVKAIGNFSHAEGLETTTYGWASHSEGYRTTSVGQSSHAEGRDTIAYGWGSHAEGRETTAYGLYSHAEGLQSTALHNNSFVWSDGTGTGVSQGIGTFTINASGGLHVIGGGGLTVNGAPVAGEYLTIDTTVVGTDQLVDSFVTTASDGAEFIITGKNGANYKIIKILAIWDGTTVNFSTVGTQSIGNTSDLTFTVDINTGNVRLLSTSTLSWDIKVKRLNI